VPTSSNTTTKTKVDVVYTWVDGSDPLHIKKRLKYQKKMERGSSKSGNLQTRWGSSGELLLSIYATRRFAPWIDKIFLITDAQCPYWLTEEKLKELNIIMVDHKQIFYGLENRLPIFNSISIESVLFRVPDLSEKFLYLNDDVLIINKTTVNNFFSHCGLPIYRGQWLVLEKKKRNWASQLIRKIKEKVKDHLRETSDSSTAAQRRSAKKIGYKEKYFRFSHTPFPLLKSAFKSIMSQDDIIDRNTRFRFRNRRQFSPIALVTHKLFSIGHAVHYDDQDQIYIEAGEISIRKIEKLKKDITNKEYKILCLQSLDEASVSLQNATLEVLSSHIGVPDDLKANLIEGVHQSATATPGNP